MISFRYHLVSIIAVFLALALGILVGTTGLNGAILSDLKKQVRTLRGETASLQSKNDTLTSTAGSDEKFVSDYMKPILAGRLLDQSVIVVSSPGTPGRIKSGVIGALEAAGAKVPTQIELAPAYIDPARAADITGLVSGKSLPVGLNLPVTQDTTILSGALLGYVLSPTSKAAPTDLAQVLASFSGLRMLTVNNHPAAAPLAIVLGSGTYLKTDGHAKAMPALISEFSAFGIKTVVAGDTLSAMQAGLVAQVRGNSSLQSSVSTVDDADTSIGQITAALALAQLLKGTSGQYGTGSGASSLYPPAPK